MPTRKLPLSSNPEWTVLPSDPNMPFTPEQDAAFYSPGAVRMLRDLVVAAASDDAFMRRLATSAASAAPVYPTLNATAVRKGA